MRAGFLTGIVAAVAVTSAAHAARYQLHNHPDGAAAPPTYGLRLDGLFGAGQTTFSFDTAEGVFLTVLGGDIRIQGVIELVEVRGNTSTAPELGMLFDVDFTYRENVNGVSNGWIVDPGHAANNGTLISQNDSSLFFVLFDAPQSGNSFDFRADGDRIDNDTTTWVGDGWLDVINSSGQQVAVGATQDWLFTAEYIPSPLAGAMAGIGLMGVGARRRR